MEVCGRCTKAVYNADLKKAANKSWHRWCFKCIDCNTSLTLGKEVSHEGEIYCAKCHGGKFGAAGYRGAHHASIDSHKQNKSVFQKIETPDNAVPVTLDKFHEKATNETAGAKFCSGCGTPAVGKFCASCGNPLN
mmetsp:Transcript_14973/g.25726  ORF Transcript_14973/g.25726 Transcript_14973/m.25726 type:complete len:135 (-) Transcript_14973:3-407(-)